METVLGLIGLVIFIFAVVALAAGVTWLVVRFSPNPADKKPKQPKQPEPQPEA